MGEAIISADKSVDNSNESVNNVGCVRMNIACRVDVYRWRNAFNASLLSLISIARGTSGSRIRGFVLGSHIRGFYAPNFVLGSHIRVFYISNRTIALCGRSPSVPAFCWPWCVIARRSLKTSKSVRLSVLLSLLFNWPDCFQIIPRITDCHLSRM